MQKKADLQSKTGTSQNVNIKHREKTHIRRG